VFSESEYSRILGLILGVVHFKWWFFTTYLGVSSPSKWRDSYSHKHLLIFFFVFLFFSLHHSSILLFIIVWFSSSSYVSFHALYFRTYIIIIFTIIVFSLCPLEVNLHTYLTTWLSSCQVRIFFGFLT